MPPVRAGQHSDSRAGATEKSMQWLSHQLILPLPCHTCLPLSVVRHIVTFQASEIAVDNCPKLRLAMPSLNAVLPPLDLPLLIELGYRCPHRKLSYLFTFMVSLQ